MPLWDFPSGEDAAPVECEPTLPQLYGWLEELLLTPNIMPAENFRQSFRLSSSAIDILYPPRFKKNFLSMNILPGSRLSSGNPLFCFRTTFDCAAELGCTKKQIQTKADLKECIQEYTDILDQPAPAPPLNRNAPCNTRDDIEKVIRSLELENYDWDRDLDCFKGTRFVIYPIQYFPNKRDARVRDKLNRENVSATFSTNGELIDILEPPSRKRVVMEDYNPERDGDFQRARRA